MGGWDAGVDVKSTPAFLSWGDRSMANRVIVVAAAVALSAVAGGAWAHHSAAQFDFGQTVKIQGVVKELRIANPHTALFLEVKDAKGAHVVEFEAHSRNNV